MKRRKPTSASARQKISQALKGKKRKRGGLISKKTSLGFRKKSGVKLGSKELAGATAVGITGGLAATALLRKRKGKAPAGLLSPAAEKDNALAVIGKGQGGGGTKKESVGRKGPGLYRNVGKGDKESITGSTKRGGGKLGRFLRNNSPRRK